MICCHRRRAGEDLEEVWEARRLREARTLTTVSRWERLVRKARQVRRPQRHFGHIGLTLQNYGSTFRTRLQDMANGKGVKAPAKGEPGMCLVVVM